MGEMIGKVSTLGIQYVCIDFILELPEFCGIDLFGSWLFLVSVSGDFHLLGFWGLLN